MTSERWWREWVATTAVSVVILALLSVPLSDADFASALVLLALVIGIPVLLIGSALRGVLWR